jgi:hypothetical protein
MKYIFLSHLAIRLHIIDLNVKFDVYMMQLSMDWVRPYNQRNGMKYCISSFRLSSLGNLRSWHACYARAHLGVWGRVFSRVQGVRDNATRAILRPLGALGKIIFSPLQTFFTRCDHVVIISTRIGMHASCMQTPELFAPQFFSPLSSD